MSEELAPGRIIGKEMREDLKGVEKRLRRISIRTEMNFNGRRHKVGEEAKKQTKRVEWDRPCRDVQWWHWTVHEGPAKRVELSVERNLQEAAGEVSDGGDRHIETVIHGERWKFKGLYEVAITRKQREPSW